MFVFVDRCGLDELWQKTFSACVIVHAAEPVPEAVVDEPTEAPELIVDAPVESETPKLAAAVGN